MLDVFRNHLCAAFLRVIVTVTIPVAKLSYDIDNVNGIHDDVPFFTGKARGSVKYTQPSSNEVSGNSADFEKKTRIRSAILQRLKDLKSLKDDGVLDENEFASQKDKLLTELSSL
ncbi:hypothetical protein AWC38_SpisGene22062 [Stylophora pistillata]|uniref:SHOCT domain-containing protein n=1 Tax=Stylophora pistillata TaxID=50429 RepID=A0A2B4RBT3_STYPI|nr:hypothetical protein AWC38_SpisGene22062 [Stylophora pistillata]